MSDTHDDYYNLAERITDAFSEIDSDICTDLMHSDSEYATLCRESSELKQAHPIIVKLLEGEGEISLSAEEHTEFIRYLDLKFKIEEAERMQLYFRGHTDSFAYLKKIGAI